MWFYCVVSSLLVLVLVLMRFSCVVSLLNAIAANSGAACLAVRCEVLKENTTWLFQCSPDKPLDSGLQLLPMLDIEEWVAAETQILSPMSALVAKSGRAGIWAQQIGAVAPLKTVLGLKGFHNMSEAACRQLAHHFNIELPAGADFFEVIKSLIMCCCPKLSEEKLMNILQLRAIDPQAETAAILSGELSESFGKDSEEVQRWADSKLQEVETMKPYREKLAALVAKVKATATSSGSTSTRSKKASKAFTPGEPVTDEELFSEVMAKRFCPEEPSLRLYKDYKNRRWLGYLFKQSRSRSFQEYGDTGALALVLQWFWKLSHEAGGATCPYDWIDKAAQQP